MIWTLFFVGVLTCAGCGLNVLVTAAPNWKHEAAWVVGGIGGAGMIVAAIILRKWGF